VCPRARARRTMAVLGNLRGLAPPARRTARDEGRSRLSSRAARATYPAPVCPTREIISASSSHAACMSASAGSASAATSVAPIPRSSSTIRLRSSNSLRSAAGGVSRIGCETTPCEARRAVAVTTTTLHRCRRVLPRVRLHVQTAASRRSRRRRSPDVARFTVVCAVGGILDPGRRRGAGREEPFDYRVDR
jgi:hypothetical protein